MQKPTDFAERIESTLKNLAVLGEPIREIFHGLKDRTLPWRICSEWAVIIVIVLFFHLDHFIISQTRFKGLYPYYPWIYRIYSFSLTTMMFWLWAWSKVFSKRRKLETLTEAFVNAGLKSRIGRLPQFISDFPLDPMTRKMRFTNAGFTILSFRNSADALSTSLGIFIDDFKENREERTIDIIYSHYPLPSEVIYSSDLALRPNEFVVGQSRAQILKSSFTETPHLMIAGQTGGGKSTFLRQLIVDLHLKEKRAKFLLIDLKGGLEFYLFENRKNFMVVPHVKGAIEELQKVDELLEKRMVLLKKSQCKDIDAYLKIEAHGYMPRQFVVVDEAAEMFLAGNHAKAGDIQSARAILSRVARQGRAVGVHLIIATQRPDSKSLDSQVKANLTGVICFQMMNDASSIAVLGNGRATDLPKVPGRAIWKNGMEMIEVQTPLLTVEAAESLLGKPDSPPKEMLPVQNNHLAPTKIKLSLSSTE